MKNTCAAEWDRCARYSSCVCLSVKEGRTTGDVVKHKCFIKKKHNNGGSGVLSQAVKNTWYPQLLPERNSCKISRVGMRRFQTCCWIKPAQAPIWELKSACTESRSSVGLVTIQVQTQVSIWCNETVQLTLLRWFWDLFIVNQWRTQLCHFEPAQEIHDFCRFKLVV